MHIPHLEPRAHFPHRSEHVRRHAHEPFHRPTSRHVGVGQGAERNKRLEQFKAKTKRHERAQAGHPTISQAHPSFSLGYLHSPFCRALYSEETADGYRRGH